MTALTDSLGIIGRTDSYKLGGHGKMMRPGTTIVNSYLESRGGRFPKTIFFGLQYYIKRYLTGCVVTPEQVEKAQAFANYHLGEGNGFNYDGWMYIATELEGKLPLEIKAVPEGHLVGVSNILVNVKNTDEKVAWLTGYIESLIMKVWYPITIATNGFYLKLLLHKFREETSDDDNISFGMHDFSYRSVTTEEQSQIGGASHLLNFLGTDTIQGILFAQDFYGASNFPGFSVAASEHSISTAFGRGEGEREYVLWLLKQFPTGILSIVADTYDVYEFTTMLCEDAEIRALIEARGPGNHVVVRPDSGEPTEVISRLLDILWQGYGGRYNSKHYKVINPVIRIIQGDGIDFEMTAEILSMMKSNKFAADNLVFGSGSALMNKNFDRDTQKFAFKASYIVLNGVVTNVQKDPVTSHGKKSKSGDLKLYAEYDGSFKTVSSDDVSADRFGVVNLAGFHSTPDALKVVFLNGELVEEYTFEDIKERIMVHFKREIKNISKIDFNKFNGALVAA